ncbi:unnamed protein product, partial [marine sediment metagenome]
DMIDLFPVILVCNKVESYFDDEGDAHLIFEFGYKSKKWKFECNKTNQKAIKDAGIKSPKEVYMKKITFEKIKVRNPSTRQMVDSLSIVKVE